MEGLRKTEELGVLVCTLQRRRMRETHQMGVFYHPVKDRVLSLKTTPVLGPSPRPGSDLWNE